VKNSAKPVKIQLSSGIVGPRRALQGQRKNKDKRKQGENKKEEVEI